jgi:hypothetical protein
MAYEDIALKSTGDSWTARENNQLSDNFKAGIDLVTSKGDLLVATGSQAAARLAVGSNDQMLESNSGEATGRKWVNSGLIPIGGIVIWSGSSGSIPSGWQACDGTNGTPDLQDRFIVGAGSTYSVDDTGGADSANLAHTHTVGGLTSRGSHTHDDQYTENDGAHSHSYSGNTNGLNSTYQGSQILSNGESIGSGLPDTGHVHSFSGSTDSSGEHDHIIEYASDGAHTHTLSGGATVGTDSQLSSPQDLRPPYYALIYIQRMS